MKFYVATACVALATAVAAEPQPGIWEFAKKAVSPTNIDDVTASRDEVTNWLEGINDIAKSYGFVVDLGKNSKISKAADSLLNDQGEKALKKLSEYLGYAHTSGKDSVAKTLDAQVAKIKGEKDDIDRQINKLFNNLVKGKNVKKATGAGYMRFKNKFIKTIDDPDLKAIAQSLFETGKKGVNKHTRKYKDQDAETMIKMFEEKAKALGTVERKKFNKRVQQYRDEVDVELNKLKRKCGKFMKGRGKCNKFLKSTEQQLNDAKTFVGMEKILQFGKDKVQEAYNTLIDNNSGAVL